MRYPRCPVSASSREDSTASVPLSTSCVWSTQPLFVTSSRVSVKDSYPTAVISTSTSA